MLIHTYMCVHCSSDICILLGILPSQGTQHSIDCTISTRSAHHTHCIERRHALVYSCVQFTCTYRLLAVFQTHLGVCLYVYPLCISQACVRRFKNGEPREAQWKTTSSVRSVSPPRWLIPSFDAAHCTLRFSFSSLSLSFFLAYRNIVFYFLLFSIVCLVFLLYLVLCQLVSTNTKNCNVVHLYTLRDALLIYSMLSTTQQCIFRNIAVCRPRLHGDALLFGNAAIVVVMQSFCICACFVGYAGTDAFAIEILWLLWMHYCWFRWCRLCVYFRCRSLAAIFIAHYSVCLLSFPRLFLIFRI